MIWSESNIILAIVGMVTLFTNYHLAKLQPNYFNILWQTKQKLSKNDDWFIRNAIYCWLNYFGEEHQWHMVLCIMNSHNAFVPTKPRPAKRRKTTNATPKTTT